MTKIIELPPPSKSFKVTIVGGHVTPPFEFFWGHVTRDFTSPRSLLKGSEKVEAMRTQPYDISGLWLNQPIWKICSSNCNSSPIFGLKITNPWNHRLASCQESCPALLIKKAPITVSFKQMLTRNPPTPLNSPFLRYEKKVPASDGTWCLAGFYKGVSKNRGTPKWMVYNGKPY